MTPEFLRSCAAALALAFLLTAPSSRGASVVISEFLAGNTSGLEDEDGNQPDWVELRNRSGADVNLDGWFLTDDADDLRRWRFPATNLPPNGVLLVFASGKDRRVPGRPLHTNFRLGSSGEALALVMPDGATVASGFLSDYPPQWDDVSYGTGLEVTPRLLVPRRAAVRYQVPREAAGDGSWMRPEFDDRGWVAGETGLGFSAGGVVPPGVLVGYWPVDEGAGVAASNRVSGGAHGVLKGAAWAVDPARGTVLDFNGRDAYVAAGTLPAMPVAGEFTWSFWYRQRTVPNQNAVILGNRAGGAPGALQFIKFTPSHFEYYRDGNIGFIPYGVTSGSWHHLAVVKRNEAMNYYDNGRLVGSSRAGGDIAPNPFYWGGDPGAPGEYADGLIDDVSLWSRALTPEQVSALAGGAPVLSVAAPGYTVATDLGSAMRGVSAGVRVRIPFVVPPGSAFDTLRLRIQYDDGFVAYLNGVEVGRRNAPATVRWDSAATAERPLEKSGEFEELDLTGALGSLVAGTNLLAFHGLNRSVDDPDFVLVPELEASSETDLGWRYFQPPTPGESNGRGYLGVVADVAFDRPRGFYDAPIEVGLRCATPGVVIRYTTDGTEPGADRGLTYQGPVPVRRPLVLRAGAYRDGYLTRAEGVGAQSYLFLDQVLTQNGAGLPTAWGNDWAMDSRVVTHPAYVNRIRDDLKSLPVMSLAFDPAGFWGPSGIYTLTAGRGDEYERGCSVEMFFPDGSEPGFQANCGVQIVGGASRSMTPKHGIGLTFKSRYGPTKLRYRFFPDTPVDEFDFLALRPNFNMSWVRTDNSGPLNNANADGAERTHALYIRDQFTKESLLAMGQPGAHERFVHLYLNGIYWGLYNPCERTDATFAAAYLGGRKEDYDAIFSDPSTVARAHDGDKNAWIEMMTIAGRGLSTPEAYARIQQYANVTNLADYMMLNFYCATVDWPWQNWNAARRRAPGAQFHFFVWDAEYTLETPPWVPDDRTDVGAASGDADSPARLYHQLRSNPEWRLLFADRLQRHCFGDGVLTPARTTARFLRLCDTIDRAIVGESARWGDVVRRSQPYTRDVEWLAEKQRLLTQFFPQRTSRLVQQCIRAGLYPALAAPTVRMVTDGGSSRVVVEATAGIVYLTTDGRDPRLPGGAVASGASAAGGPLALEQPLRIRARAWQGGAWSALVEADLDAAPAPPVLDLAWSGGSVVLSWPGESAGYVLETTERLSPPAWVPVAGVVGNRVTVPIGSASQFFRLRRGP